MEFLPVMRYCTALNRTAKFTPRQQFRWRNSYGVENMISKQHAMRKESFCDRLYAAYEAGLSGQAKIFVEIAKLPDAASVAQATLIDCEERKKLESLQAERQAGSNPETMRRLLAAVYHWYTRATTILKVIATGNWDAEMDGMSYTEMYAVAAQIVRPARKRQEREGLMPRQIQTASRIIQQASGEQALEFIIALADRLDHLGESWASTLAKQILMDTERYADADLLEEAQEKVTELSIPPPTPERRQRRAPLTERLSAERVAA